MGHLLPDPPGRFWAPLLRPLALLRPLTLLKPLTVLPSVVILSAVLLSVLLPGAGPLTAQDISVRSYLNSGTVGVGSTFVVNLEVAGSQNLDSEPEIPDLGTFAAYLGSGSSSSMQIVNGRTTVSLTLQYRFQALEEGTFEIPSISLSVEGRDFETEAMEIVVSTAPPPDPVRSGRTTEAAEVSPEELFITAETSRNRIREGQPFVVEYRIFTRVDVGSYSLTRIPEPSGFWVEELPLPNPPQVEQVVRDGQQYTSAVIRRVALVPTGAGERTLEPLGVEAQVRMRRQTLDPFESIFERSSLFGTVVPTTVLSNPISLEVEALPPGRPEPFSGVVGSLALTAALDRDSVDANQAVTLTVTARGEGNLKGIPEPALDLPMDFEAYPPEISESVQRSGEGLRGTKVWEYVLIPRAPGARTIPPVVSGYFDTATDSYRTASTEPQTLLVSGEILEGPSALVRGGVETLREDIRFIHLGSARLSPSGHSVFSGSGFWTLLLLPMVGLLGALALRVHWDRLQRDPAYARRRKAGRVAHARLAEARRMAGGDTPKEFYAETARALRGFVSDKLNLSEAGLQISEAEAGLRGKGVSEPVVEEVSACLEHCDLQRFAPPKNDPSEEARFLDRVSTVMTELNREMGR